MQVRMPLSNVTMLPAKSTHHVWVITDWHALHAHAGIVSRGRDQRQAVVLWTDERQVWPTTEDSRQKA